MVCKMKKLMLAFAGFSLVISCGQKEKPVTEPEQVQFTITYSLPTSNGQSMTRVSGAEVFDLLYAKMKTGEMVAPTYSLVFTNKDNGENYTFNGNWSRGDMITLPSGIYNVTGTSSPGGAYLQDKASLSFNTQVEIKTGVTSVVLNADYDCFLLTFTKSNIESLQFSTSKNSAATMEMFLFDNQYYYSFAQNLKVNGYTSRLIGRRNNGASFVIDLNTMDFQIGKYYHYNDLSGGFNIPKMEEGK